MYLHGEFINRNGDTIAVHIVTQNDRTQEKVIGGDSTSDFFFPFDEAVTITSEVNDTFDHLLVQSATINLQASYYEPSLYGASCMDCVVNILRNGEVVFAGFVEPLSYSQNYNEPYDDVSLNCIDCLSALQYAKYKDVGALGVDYTALRQNAEQRTLLDLVKEIVADVTANFDILGKNSTLHLYYDRSKAIDSFPSHQRTILSDISISELLFLEDSEDDVWTKEEVLAEIMRYLNLHIRQDGLDFYIFDWKSVRVSSSVWWTNLIDEEDDPTTTAKTVEIETAIAADCNTQISVGEVYNQLLLTDNVKEMENVVESPLDSDSLSYAFDGKQKYMTEISCKGEGTTSFNAFFNLVQDKTADYDAATLTDWFIQLRKCEGWTFYLPQTSGRITVDSFFTGKNQETLLQYMGLMPCAAAVVSLGKVQKDNGGNDNSPVSKVSMTDCLVISVNGNGDDTESGCYPGESTLKASIPCAEYTGSAAGGVFSPSDGETTNYIVISGSMVMNPLMPVTDNYTRLRKAAETSDETMLWLAYWHHTVDMKDGEMNRYYTRKMWKAENWKDEPAADDSPDLLGNPCFIPYTEEGVQSYPFNYSGVGDSTDNISKVSVIACMLIIGDKCVVEKQPGDTLDTLSPGTGNGQLSDYVWRTYKTREECASDDEYYQQSFTVGFDPKIGDKIIGTEFGIQNNLSYTDGVDEEGTAIPIRKSDKVSGAVKFIILGPVNSLWNNITRRHPTFFRHTKWSSETIPLLSHTSCIIIKELEIKVCSDNGKMGSGDDGKDIIFMSDTKESFVNRKDDLEFKITTALTSAECKALGVKNSVNLSTPLDVTAGDALLAIRDRINGNTAKPEQHYVDAYWQEWHSPRVMMEQNLIDTGDTVSPWNLYHEKSMDKTFFVQGISRNLSEGTAEMTLKEIFD